MEAIVEATLNSGLNSTLLHLNYQIDKDCRNVIKDYLRLSKTRGRGLFVLNIFLDECSDDAFVEDCSLWFQFAVDSIAESDSSRRSFVFEILAKLLLQLKHFPEAMKSISSSDVNKLLELLCKPKCVTVSSLKCLDAYLTTYSGQCGAKKNQIKQFIIESVGSVNNSEIMLLESCFAKLVITGNAGHLSIHHQTEWVNQIKCCISNLYQLLSVYNFTGKVKEYTPLSPNIKKCDSVFELISGNATNRCLKTVLQFEFLSGVIREMLRLSLQATVKINIAEILNLISATLSIGYNSLLEHTNVDTSILITVLPAMQTSALLLLKSLVQVCHCDLAIHSHFVNQLLLQIMESTHLKNSREWKKPVLMLRKVCYDTFYVWFSNCGLIALFDEKMTERFLKQLKGEFEASDSVELKDAKCVRKQDMRNRQRNIPLNVEQQCVQVKTSCLKGITCILEAMLTEFNSIALNAFLINSCVTLSEQHYNNISSFIINEILRIYRSGLYMQTNLYDSCRKAFLSVLRSLVVNTANKASPPLSIAVVVFNEALRLEMNANIKLYCNETLSIFHNLINPVMPIRQTELAESTCVNILQSDRQITECQRVTRSLPNDNVSAVEDMEQGSNEERDSCAESESLSKSYENDISINRAQVETVNDKYKSSNCEESKCESEEDSASEVEIIEEKQKQCNDDNVNGDVHDCTVVKEKRQSDEITEKYTKKLKSDACVSEEVENLLLDFVDIPASNQ